MNKALLSGITGASVVTLSNLKHSSISSSIDLLMRLFLFVPLGILLGGSTGMLASYVTRLVIPSFVESYASNVLLGGGVGLIVSSFM